jgi:hypothetical protein
MLIQEILAPLTKLATSAARSVDTYKLRSIISNMRPIDRLPPLEARNELSVMIGNLKRIQDEIPQVDNVVKFLQQQQNNPSPNQVLQMAVEMLKKIV